MPATYGTSPRYRRQYQARLQTDASGVAVWTFPSAFKVNPIVSHSIELTAADTISLAITALSTTTVSIKVVRISKVLNILSFNTSVQCYVHLIATEAQ